MLTKLKFKFKRWFWGDCIINNMFQAWRDNHQFETINANNDKLEFKLIHEWHSVGPVVEVYINERFVAFLDINELQYIINNDISNFRQFSWAHKYTNESISNILDNIMITDKYGKQYTFNNNEIDSWIEQVLPIINIGVVDDIDRVSEITGLDYKPFVDQLFEEK